MRPKFQRIPFLPSWTFYGVLIWENETKQTPYLSLTVAKKFGLWGVFVWLVLFVCCMYWGIFKYKREMIFYAIHAWNTDFGAWKCYAIIFKIIYFKSIHPFSMLVQKQLLWAVCAKYNKILWEKKILFASCYFGFLFRDQSSLNPQFCRETLQILMVNSWGNKLGLSHVRAY